MARNRAHAVTGALGYSGRYIAQRLLHEGHPVISLSNSNRHDPALSHRLDRRPLNFHDPDRLAYALRGVSVLYNTYWVRFNHALFTHADAVRNSLILFDAARKAGVERIVHISITNPSPDSNLEYFREKAFLESVLMDSGLSYAILRPAVIFGAEDILINNIAWFLRRLPVFAVPGDGSYRLQPIFVDDLARLAVDVGRGREDRIVEAIGPETFTYQDLVREMARILGKRRLIVPAPPSVVLFTARMIGRLVDDIILTREEIEGLMKDCLFVDAPPAGTTRLTTWARQNAAMLGQHYHSELALRRRRDVGEQTRPVRQAHQGARG